MSVQLTGCEPQRERLRSVLDSQNLEGAILSSYQAVSYLAGTNILTQVMLPDRPAFYLCWARGGNALLVCNIETGMVLGQTDIAEVHEYVEFADDPWLSLSELLTEQGLASERVGFEARRVPAAGYESLRNRLPGLTLVPIDDAVEELQGVKTAGEVQQLRHAAEVTLGAVLAAVGRARAADGELGLSAEMTATIVRGAGTPMFTFLASGERALGAHEEPLDRAFQPGEIWRVDLGARFFDRVNSDVARTGVVGDASERQREILRNVLAAQAAGFNAVVPGRPASDVFEAVKAEFERRAMPFRMPHVGHGLGGGLHEFPILHPMNPAPLEPGMVLAIEPMLKFPDRGECYHVEDLLVVTDDGCELLTEPQRDFLEIEP